MAIINNRAFTGNIVWIRGHAEKMRDRLVSSVAFMAFHAAKHGNKEPLQKWQAAETGLPGWVRDMAKEIPLKRDKNMTEEQAEETALRIVMFAYADREERNALQRKKRAAMVKAAPEVGETAKSVPTATAAAKPSAGKKADVSNSVPHKVTNALLIGGQTIELTAAEAKALQEHLQALRKPAPKRATRKAS